MTVYLFDADKRVRKIIPPNGLTQLIHDEAAHLLYATVSMDCKVVNGEYLGFRCIDGKFRLFTVTNSENKDDNRTTIITATDAIVQELREIIVEDYQPLDVTLMDAINGLLEAAGVKDAWTVTGAQPERTEKSRAYFATLWVMLESYMTLYKWQIIPYYTFFGGSISGRVIELKEDKAEFRGRILTSKKDASNVYVIKNNPPYTRLYGIGPATGSGDLQTNMTFADVSWSIASGNPADKPKGQAWVEDWGAVAKYGLHTAVVQINEAEDAEQLIEKTWEELQRLKEPSCTVEATVQDLEQVPGYKNQVIRLGDLVPIRLSNATMETARVIGIKRDYLQHWLTKIVIGDKEATIQSQVSSLIAGAAHTFERLTIYKNRFREDEALIQLNAEFVQANAKAIELNAKEIRANAELISLKAEKSEVTEMGTRIREAEILIDALDARIDLIATESSVEELAERVSRAEIRINGAEQTVDIFAGTLDEFGNRLDGAEVLVNGMESKINLKADKTTVDGLDERLNQAEIDINGAEAAIDLWAGEIDEFGNRLDGAEVLINGMESRINLKADKTTVDGLDERLNQAEIDINGAEAAIDLWAGEIDEFGNRLDGAEILINGMESRISLKADKTTVDGLARQTAELQVKYDQISTKVEDNEGNVSTLTQTVNGFSAKIEDVEGNVSTIDNTVNGLSQRVENAEGQVAEFETTINGLRNTVTNNTGDISTLTNTISGLNSTVSGHTGSISTLTNTIGGLTSRVEDAEGNITTLQTTSSGFETRVTNAEGRVAALSVTVSEQGSRIDAQAETINLKADQSTVAALTSRVSTAEADISAAEAAIKLKASTAVTDALSYGLSDAEEAIREAEVRIDGAEAAIALKANQSTVDGMNNRLSQAEIDIDGLDARIDLIATESDVTELAERVSQAEVRISGAEETIDLWAGEIDEFGERLDGAEIKIDGLEKDITAAVNDVEGKVAAMELSLTDLESSAMLKTVYEENRTADLQLISNAEKSIATLRTQHGNQIAGLEYFLIDLESSALMKTVYEENRTADLQLIANATESVERLETKYDGQIASLELKATEQDSLISAKADLILLNGYVKASELETEVLFILDNAWAEDLSVNTFVANSVNTFFLSADDIRTDALLVEGYNFTTHSHAVTVNSDGTITLGEVSSTGGSFKIADTQFYKDGVSAARNSVTLTSMGWQGGRNVVEASNGKSLTVDLPTFSTSGGDTWNAYNQTTVFFYTGSVNGPLASKTVDASSVYKAGYDLGLSEGSGGGAESVTLTSSGWVNGSNVISASNGMSLRIDLPTFSATGGTTWTNNKTTVHFSTPSVTSPLISKEVDASSVYTSGYGAGSNNVTISAAGWVGGSNVVSASNGKSVTVSLPSFTTSGGTTWDSNNRTTVYFYTGSVNGPLASRIVDASSIYEKGLVDGAGSGEVEITLSASGWDGMLNTITASNGASLTVDATPIYELGKGSVTLSVSGWQYGGVNTVTASNGESERITLPPFTSSGGTSFDANHQTTVFFYTGSVTGPLATRTVDASSVYKAGYDLGLSEGSGGGADSVTLSSGGWVGGSNVVTASNGKSLRIDLPAFSATGGTTWSGNKTTVYFSTPSVTSPLISKEVDASSVYTSGYNVGSNGVTISAAGWVGGSNVVSASNGKSVTVALPTFTTSGGTTFSNNKTTVYFYTGSVNGPLASREVDASSVYDAGYAAGVASVDTAAAYDEGYAAGYEAAKAAVKVTAGISQSGFPAQYYARYYYWATATIDGEEVGSASGYQSFNVSGAM